jgi:putative endonuclease
MHQTDLDDFQIFRLAHAAQQLAVNNRQRRLRKSQSATRPNTKPSTRSAKQSTGDAFETLACRYLEQQGLTLLARQLACPRGEIDLVLKHGPCLVFVEVRARNDGSYGGAAASISLDKQRKLICTAKWHLPALSKLFFAGITPPSRIDVMTFDHGHLQWIQDAIRLGQDK